ncbi:MAG: thioredoxin domain-containing protein [Gemmatimonadaceae bacterium]|nr:thioredoxin domain-containing protein [Gemmatimonadaceae bacterium]
MTATNKIRLGLDVLATAAAVGACGILLYFNWGKIFPLKAPIPQSPLALDGASLRGSAEAPVVVIEYSDYVCPFCGKAEREVMPEIHKKYIATGKVQLAFRQHPLEKLHPGATRAAVAALCAGQQGRFWEMHDALFRDPKNIDEADLLARARSLDLDEGRFLACGPGEAAMQVQRDVKEAEDLRLGGTPVFLIGRRQGDGRIRVVSVVDGAHPFEVFQKQIEAASAPESRHISAIIAMALAAIGVGFWIRGKNRRKQEATA